MSKFKNTPYVKHYDSNGVLTNPIQKAYINPFPNRNMRRAMMKGKVRYDKTFNQVVKTDYRDRLITLKQKYIKAVTEFKNNIANIIKNGVYRSQIMVLNSLYGQYRTALYKGSANKQWI